MELPKMLKHSTTNFPVLRKGIKMTVNSGANCRAGEMIRFNLPTSSLVDGKPLHIVSLIENFKNDGTTPSLGKVQNAYSLIRRMGFTIGGVSLGYENNEYNQICHIENVTSIGLDQNAGNLLSSEFPAEGERLGHGDLISFTFFPYSLVNMGIIDTSVYGECEIDILLDNENVLYFPDGGDTEANLTLKDIRCYTDVLQLQDDTYQKVVTSHLQSGGTYKKAIDLCTVVTQKNQNSNSFNVSTMSLNDVTVGVKPEDYRARATADANSPYSNLLNFNCGATDTATAQGKSMYIEVNSQSLPQYGFGKNFLELSNITRNNYAGSVYNYNKLFLDEEQTKGTKGSDHAGLVLPKAFTFNKNAFLTKNAIVKFKVGGEGPATSNNGKFTGIDLKGNSIIRVNTTGLSTDDILIMSAQHSSLLEAKAGQVVFFVK